MLAHSQYLAEKEPIQILPKFRLKKLKLVSGDVGPFIPQSPATVPLWLALLLRKQSRCTIIIPGWLSEDVLKQIRDKEKESSHDTFQPLHDHYREIALLLLNYATEEFENANAVRTLIEDIANIRQAKIQKGMKETLANGPQKSFFQLTDLSAIELNEIGPFLLQGLGMFDKLVSTLHRTQERQEQEAGNSNVTQVIRKGGRKLTKYS